MLAVSAQKGLVAKITDDAMLLAAAACRCSSARSPRSSFPGKQAIVRETTRHEIVDLLVNTRSILEARLAGVLEQLVELRNLRGKNLDVVEEMMRKVRVEKEEFEHGLARFQATRGRVLAAHQHALHPPGHGCAERRSRAARSRR